MLSGHIPLVHIESIGRVALVHLDHEPIPGHLGDHRRRRDACGDPVSLWHRQARHVEPGYGKSVAQHERRPGTQVRDGAAHPGDVAAVQADPVHIGAGDDQGAPRHGAFHDFSVDLLSPARCEQLGIGQPIDPVPPFGRQDHGTDDERAGAGPPPCLVHARDRGESTMLERPLEAVQPRISPRCESKRPSYPGYADHGTHTQKTSGRAGGAVAQRRRNERACRHARKS